MKNKLFGVLTVIIALALTLTACPEPEPDPQCECIVKVHLYGSPCTCPAAGTSACDCTEEPPTHTHDAGTWITTQQPTCTEAGTKELRCTVDNFVLDTDTIPALGHDWGDWVVTTPATTTADGEETRTCKNDATHKETQPIDKLPPPPCTCGAGTKREPGVPCCEDPACPCPIAEPQERNFEVSFDFQNPIDASRRYNATINDERVACGSADLENVKVNNKNIVAIIEEAIQGSFNTFATSDLRKGRYRNVFGATTGSVTIIVDNSSTYYEGTKTPDRYTMKFHIDYLKSNPVGIMEAIDSAVGVMNEMPHKEVSKAVGRGVVQLASIGTSGQHLKQTARG